MVWTSLISSSLILIIFEAASSASHKLITNPYPDNEWDSIIVSSDPIIIKEKKNNQTTPLKLNHILRAQKRSFTDCPQNDFNCLYGNDKYKNENQLVDKFLKQFSGIANVKYDDGGYDISNQNHNQQDYQNIKKSNWNKLNSQIHHHPYDDQNGWITLEPVPWSTSKISKWHPNKVVAPQNLQQKPWGYEFTTQPSTHQFWASAANYQPQIPQAHWGIGTNDIITDNKPSGFPINQHFNSFQSSSYHHPNQGHGYGVNHNDFKGTQRFSEKLPTNSHPSTYPSNGNGEWILLSTTKGYSQPHKWSEKLEYSKSNFRKEGSRKIKPLDISKYHEEDLEDLRSAEKNSFSNRISNLNAEKINESAEDSTNNSNTIKNNKIKQIKSTTAEEEPVKHIRRKVRLYVLPSLISSSTSHGGLLEVDSDTQTVDEAQQEDEKLKKLKEIATVRKSKPRGYKIVPMNKVSENGINPKSAVTLAAVGAGMIPAALAILLPMALNREKRSFSDIDPKMYVSRRNSQSQ